MSGSIGDPASSPLDAGACTLILLFSLPSSPGSSLASAVLSLPHPLSHAHTGSVSDHLCVATCMCLYTSTRVPTRHKQRETHSPSEKELPGKTLQPLDSSLSTSVSLVSPSTLSLTTPTAASFCLCVWRLRRENICRRNTSHSHSSLSLFPTHSLHNNSSSSSSSSRSLAASLPSTAAAAAALSLSLSMQAAS